MWKRPIAHIICMWILEHILVPTMGTFLKCYSFPITPSSQFDAYFSRSHFSTILCSLISDHLAPLPRSLPRPSVRPSRLQYLRRALRYVAMRRLKKRDRLDGGDDGTSRRDNDLRARLREISRPFIFTWYLDLHGFSDDVWDYLTELTDWWDLGKTKAFLKLPEGISEMRVLATFEVGLIGRLKWKYLWHPRIDDIARRRRRRRRRLLFFAVWRKWWELLRN